MQDAKHNMAVNQIDIESRIQKACDQVSRNRKDIELIAVSKRQGPERIQKALENGIRCFGENQVQEALARWQPIKPLYPDLCLHLIGSLQSNKAADAVSLFDVIHTIDREKIAKVISLEMIKQNKPLRIDGDGSQTRDFIHVDDIVDANIFCMNYKNNFNGVACDIGTGTSTSLSDIRNIIDDNLNVKWNEQPARIGDIQNSKADVKYINNLGWSPQIDIKSGLKQCFGD